MAKQEIEFPFPVVFPASPNWKAFRAKTDDEGALVVEEDGKTAVLFFMIKGWGIPLPSNMRGITIPGSFSIGFPGGGFFGGPESFELVPLDAHGARLDGEALIMISPPAETIEQAMARLTAAEVKMGRKR